MDKDEMQAYIISAIVGIFFLIWCIGVLKELFSHRKGIIEKVKDLGKAGFTVLFIIAAFIVVIYVAGTIGSLLFDFSIALKQYVSIIVIAAFCIVTLYIIALIIAAVTENKKREKT